MPNRDLSAYMSRVDQEMPTRIYEHYPASLIGGGAIAAVGVYFQEKYLPGSGLVESLGSVAAYLSGAIADMVTTKRAIGAVEDANQEGIDIVMPEVNSMIGDVRTIADYKAATKKPSVRIAEAGGLGFSVLSPLAGGILGAVRLTAAFSNRRKTRRLGRLREILAEG